MATTASAQVGPVTMALRTMRAAEAPSHAVPAHSGGPVTRAIRAMRAAAADTVAQAPGHRGIGCLADGEAA